MLELKSSFAQKLNKSYCYSLSKVRTVVVTIVIILVITGTTMTVAPLLLTQFSSSSSSSPMPLFIQSAEAATSEASNCFIGTPTIIGTENDDVIKVQKEEITSLD
jgi:hypothetical protein